MPTYNNDSDMEELFLFNQIISRFGIPREIVTDHGSHFQNQLLFELALKLGFWKEHPSPYYPQDNGQVEQSTKPLRQSCNGQLIKISPIGILCCIRLFGHTGPP